jgi:hypothetical protein
MAELAGIVAAAAAAAASGEEEEGQGPSVRRRHNCQVSAGGAAA